MYWNGVLVGNSWTGNAGIGQAFTVQGTAGINLLRVEYSNSKSGATPHFDGSYYSMSVRAEPVPEPATLVALALGAAGAMRHRRVRHGVSSN